MFSGDVSAEEYARNATGACGSRLENRAAPRARIAREAGRVIKDIVSVMGDERGEARFLRRAPLLGALSELIWGRNRGLELRPLRDRASTARRFRSVVGHCEEAVMGSLYSRPSVRFSADDL